MDDVSGKSGNKSDTGSQISSADLGMCIRG